MPTEQPMTTIARQQQIYNSHLNGTAGNSIISSSMLSKDITTVSQADKVAVACNLLNTHIFTNLMAGLPISLYVGNIPTEMEDTKLMKILECFGRVTKWTRPIDPTTLMPRGFGFVTYLQGICGFRCFQILNNYLYDSEEGLAFQVKLGTKERAAIMSIEESENEAKKNLPEDSSVGIEDIYTHMKTLVSQVIDPPPVLPPPPSIAVTSSETTAKVAEEKGLGIQDLMDADEDTVGEKLQSEIEKFRMRQKIRDVELEEQRRQKIKNKIKQLNEAKLYNEKNPPAPPTTNGDDTNMMSTSSRGQDESTRKRTERPRNDMDDLETKRRRKLEVLQMLSDDADIGELAAEFVPAAPAPPVFVPPPTVPGPLKLLSFNTAATTTATVKVLKRNVGEEEEEESKPKREFVPLDFGEDQPPPISTATAAPATAASVVETVLQRHLQQQLQQIEDDDDDEELDGDKDGGAFKKNMTKRKNLLQLAATTATAIPDSVQAKVLAQAQVISAALASGLKQQSTTVVVDKKEALKKLVDNIPTRKEDLFSYSVNWKMVDEYDLIQSVMRPWIVKKIIEYLGEEEESLTSFMVSKLQAHCQPGDLLEELSMVLDDDSEQFVLKLWRMLIYHSLRVAMK